jgi:hypothetical protein
LLLIGIAGRTGLTDAAENLRGALILRWRF